MILPHPALALDRALVHNEDSSRGWRHKRLGSWADWNKGRGLSAAQLANRLRGFGTVPLGLLTRKTRLDAEKTAQRWHREDFVDAWTAFARRCRS